MSTLSTFLDSLHAHQLPNGGFPYQPGYPARPDSTAWATITLEAYQPQSSQAEAGRSYLASLQDAEGKIPISPDHPEACWPTPLALLTWYPHNSYQRFQNVTIDFLLGFTGEHWELSEPSTSGHDTSIRGWPWIQDTHSWVIPTSLTIVALQLVGLGDHHRVEEGHRMILNRQLPEGGWNYGNTMVFGKELHPLPEATGVALQALAGRVPRKHVQHSLKYLSRELSRLRTPISLGWALLGLGAWDIHPQNKLTMIQESLTRQERFGPYPLPSLALLLCAAKSSKGLLSLLQANASLGLNPLHHQANLTSGKLT